MLLPPPAVCYKLLRLVTKCGQVLVNTRSVLCAAGPNRNISEWRECVDKSVRIGLTVHPDGRHVFDDTWVVRGQCYG
jgi:hypothetical protein